VLVPLDGSARAEHALPWAIDLAAMRHAPLRLLRVVSPSIPMTIEAGASPVAYGTAAVVEEEPVVRYLQQQVDAVLATSPGLTVSTTVRVGDPADQILTAAEEEQAQLVVLTTHGRTGLARWVRGSVAEKLVRYGAAPLLLIRPWDAAPAVAGRAHLGGRVLVPLDGSSLAEQVLPEALRLAAGAEGEVVLVTVTPVEQEHAKHVAAARRAMVQSRGQGRTYLHDIARRLRSENTAVRTVVLTATDVAGAIVEQAAMDEADVIAMCTHGRGSTGRLLYGSVADRVAHEARVPVLLCHPRRASVGAQPGDALVAPLADAGPRERETSGKSPMPGSGPGRTVGDEGAVPR
jgi:nucleotide-binding universal stress UspA family protein